MDQKTTQSRVSPTMGRRQGWGPRKWKPAGPQRREAAAAALESVFAHRRGSRWILPLLLVISLALHAVLIPVMDANKSANTGDIAASEDSYIKKVEQRAKAKFVTKAITRTFVAPPPPDPEAVVSRTMSEEITGDIQKVVGNLLDVKVAAQLKDQVAANLHDELAEAAKRIADGKVSQEEIKQLQDDFKRKAHEQTVKVLQDQREKTQVQQATLTVNQWYEGKVSEALKGKIRYTLFTQNGALWGGWNRENWGFVAGWPAQRLVPLTNLLAGKYYDESDAAAAPRGWKMLPDWPAPSSPSAAALEQAVKFIREGPAARDKQKRERRNEFEWVPIGPSAAEAKLSDWCEPLLAYVEGVAPQQKAEFIKNVLAPIDALWDKLDKQVAEYKNAANRTPGTGTNPGAPGLVPVPSMQAELSACLDTLKQINELAGKLNLGDPRGRECVSVNQGIRSRVLRGPAKEEMYKRFIDGLVTVMAPPVVDLAESEFKEGIIIRDENARESMKEFSKNVLALLRRDIEQALPKGRFEDVIFDAEANPYRSKVTSQRGPPSVEDIAADESAAEKTLEKWPAADKAYVEARSAVVAGQFRSATDRMLAALTDRLVANGQLGKDFYASVETVDFQDKVQQKLAARARAMQGRGQDLAKLTEDGVPDTSAPLVALMLGASKGQGASLEPVMATMAPAYSAAGDKAETAVRPSPPRFPPAPARWGRITQPEMTEIPFKSPRMEGIPFLANFPKLDGDLRDWGRIRPLTLRDRYKSRTDEPMLLYAAWNYQGFFFGYHVNCEPAKYTYPGKYQTNENNDARSAIGILPPPAFKYGARAYGWADDGDNLKLCFDTLDSRSETRGDPHTQEFVIFPRGMETNPDVPGAERYFDSKRDAITRWGFNGWEGLKASMTVFPPEPSVEQGPDGTGPFRASVFTDAGYTVEAFLPRSLFHTPVFAPGWYIGFEAWVGVGYQHSGDWRGKMFQGQVWANPRSNSDNPSTWGDLLLLGTDPQLAVQEAQDSYELAQGIVPGHSYMITVIDPDRNVNLSAEDTVIVSVEVRTPGRPSAQGDVEVFILKETGKNTSTFRGFINTQPGAGRQVPGVLECTSGQEVVFGYVDFGNAHGERNVIYQLKLPVLSPLTKSAGTVAAGSPRP